MSDLSSLDAKQTNGEKAVVFEPGRGWTALSAIFILLAVIQSVPTARDVPTPVETPEFDVNINQASESELLSLPELGPDAARRVVEFREQNGPFETLDDLGQVPGIGPATLHTLRAIVTTEDSNRITEHGGNSPSGQVGDGRSYVRR